jgi:hypothetical protein
MGGKVFFNGLLSPTLFGSLNSAMLFLHVCSLSILKRFGTKKDSTYLLIFCFHILSIFSNSHHLLCFLAIGSFFHNADNLEFGYLPSNLKKDAIKIDTSPSIIALKLLSITWSSIYLPFGLSFADHLVSNERKTFYNLQAISFHVISMIVKSVVCIFLYVLNIGNIERDQIPNSKLYQKIISYCSVLSFLGLLTLSPCVSWLEIGINIAKYIIASTIGHGIYIMWLIACYIIKTYSET